MGSHGATHGAQHPQYPVAYPVDPRTHTSPGAGNVTNISISLNTTNDSFAYSATLGPNTSASVETTRISRSASVPAAHAVESTLRRLSGTGEHDSGDLAKPGRASAGSDPSPLSRTQRPKSERNPARASQVRACPPGQEHAHFAACSHLCTECARRANICAATARRGGRVRGQEQLWRRSIGLGVGSRSGHPSQLTRNGRLYPQDKKRGRWQEENSRPKRGAISRCRHTLEVLQVVVHHRLAAARRRRLANWEGLPSLECARACVCTCSDRMPRARYVSVRFCLRSMAKPSIRSATCARGSMGRSARPLRSRCKSRRRSTARSSRRSTCR